MGFSLARGENISIVCEPFWNGYQTHNGNTLQDGRCHVNQENKWSNLEFKEGSLLGLGNVFIDADKTLISRSRIHNFDSVGTCKIQLSESMIKTVSSKTRQLWQSSYWRI